MRAFKRNITTVAVMTMLMVLGFGMGLTTAGASPLPLTPGEKLKYALRWENIPAGELLLEIRPITTFNASPAYHFVMTAKSNAAVDLFCRIRDRIDAYADTDMTHSVFYQKKRGHKNGDRNERITFDWLNNTAQFADAGTTHAPIELPPGSFDPLTAFYFTRMAISEQNPHIERPVTDGKRQFMGQARVVAHETITLSSGKSYKTMVLEPEMGLFGGVFKESKGAKLRVWVTADEKRIPVRIKTKVKVGHFVGELVSAEGV